MIVVPDKLVNVVIALSRVAGRAATWRWWAPRSRRPPRRRPPRRPAARLAAAGAVVVTGGRGGVMAAASRGAAQAGGLVVGLLPGEDRGDANEWVGVALPTGLGSCATG